ncbi:response regulator transcription factor [Streptomyces boluensis]|uniref:HTH luxR-type domain-containing protein n=1 Tax=Streptomyces boluensis TaxID=1775135 RepID=A0A964XR04_9ACTN|nr:hypothetical protein [Streptomyces boluensis]
MHPSIQPVEVVFRRGRSRSFSGGPTSHTQVCPRGSWRCLLGLIARGLSNTELAAHLRLSPTTIKTHIGHLLAKLHARHRAQLVNVAYETGLVGDRRRGV